VRAGYDEARRALVSSGGRQLRSVPTKTHFKRLMESGVRSNFIRSINRKAIEITIQHRERGAFLGLEVVRNRAEGRIGQLHDLPHAGRGEAALVQAPRGPASNGFWAMRVDQWQFYTHKRSYYRRSECV